MPWQQKEKEMIDKIMIEHELFMYRILSGIVNGIYNSFKRICFYESLNEYFLCNEQINKEFVNISAGRSKIIKKLWDTYLKYEYLRVDTWEEIDCLLQIYVEEHSKGSENVGYIVCTVCITRCDNIDQNKMITSLCL